MVQQPALPGLLLRQTDRQTVDNCELLDRSTANICNVEFPHAHVHVEIQHCKCWPYYGRVARNYQQSVCLSVLAGAQVVLVAAPLQFRGELRATRP